MEQKHQVNRRWNIFFVIVGFIITGGLGFSWGVEHEARNRMERAKEYAPLYTSRIVVKNGDSQVIAFTTASCDSIRAKDDGYWFNQSISDSTSFIVTELVLWPWDDECK